VLGGCDKTLPSDWERKNEGLVDRQEEDNPPPPPAYPKRATLLEFEVAGQRDFHNYIDGATLRVDDKGVVRYVFVSRSPSGVENVSYEAIRCKTAETRLYAVGHSDATWSTRPNNWRPIVETRQQHLRVLYREFFCPQGNPIGDADEGRRALRAGGHPWSNGFSGDALLQRR
jgi:hypothetical protein